jgi:hypothetical protein
VSDSNIIPNDDPFSTENLAKLRVDQSFSAMSVKQVLTVVACRKPGRQEFFRTNPDPQQRFTTALFKDAESGEQYLVSPALRVELGEHVTPTLLVPTISRSSPGVPFLWPLAVPDSQRPLRWHESAIESAKLAESSWVRMTADMPSGSYLTYLASGEIPEPAWSDVPPINELLKLCFRDRFIADPQHPVCKRLRGE